MGRPKKKQSNESDRGLTWAFLVFKSSAPERFTSNIAELMLKAYVSPLHDKDYNDNGEPKAPHWHIEIMYDSLKAPEQVIEDAIYIARQSLSGCNYKEDYNFDEIKPHHYKHFEKSFEYWFYADAEEEHCIGAIIRCRSKSGYARYLVHADNPEKARYTERDVVQIGNVNYEDDFGKSYNKYDCITEMQEYCKVNKIYLFVDLMDYARNEHPNDWYRVLCDSGSYVMDMYIKSLTYKERRRRAILKGRINPEDL